MEQKTEASQAVYFPPLPEPDHSLDNGAQPYFTAIQMFAYALSQLKAQPAPTEAPNFCARCGKRLHAGSIHTCTPPAPTEAQGEDSARLDALMHASWNLECFDMPTGGDDADIGWRVIEHHMAEPIRRVVAEVYEDNPRAAIDRARASAETGGVKP